MPVTPQVSVLLPAYEAQPHIGRAIRSLLDQTSSSWEAIIASDDGVDYLALLAAHGISDPRVRQVSTGRIRSGVAAARNVALHQASAPFIAALDCDDLFHPHRLEKLLPIAESHGAVIDNIAVVEEPGGKLLGSFLPAGERRETLDVKRFLHTHIPAKPVVARKLTSDWDPAAGLSDDVVQVLRLMEQLGPLACTSEVLQEYRVRTGSECHRDDSCKIAEAGYQRILRLLREGRIAATDAEFGDLVADGIEQKRRLNFAFEKASRDGFQGTFQHYACAEYEAAATDTG